MGADPRRSLCAELAKGGQLPGRSFARHDGGGRARTVFERSFGKENQESARHRRGLTAACGYCSQCCWVRIVFGAATEKLDFSYLAGRNVLRKGWAATRAFC